MLRSVLQLPCTLTSCSNATCCQWYHIFPLYAACAHSVNAYTCSISLLFTKRSSTTKLFYLWLGSLTKYKLYCAWIMVQYVRIEGNFSIIFLLKIENKSPKKSKLEIFEKASGRWKTGANLVCLRRMHKSKQQFFRCRLNENLTLIRKIVFPKTKSISKLLHTEVQRIEHDL